MSFVGKSLADGQLAAAKATIYTCPASTRAVIKQINVVSTTGTVQRVRIYLKRSGSVSRQLCSVDGINAGERIEVLDEALSMGAADVIEGDTTTATAVDYVITGAEETP